jgi:Uma2 family endonuclease
MSDAATRSSSSPKLTYADYLELPDDGKRYEILDGDLVMTASPLIRHQRVSANLHLALEPYVREHRGGTLLYAPVDVILDRSTIAVPDLVFVSNGRSSIVTERAIEGPPDLIVEILSPSTSRRDRGIKAKLYHRFGVAHYWLVDPVRRRLEIRERRPRSYRLVAKYEGDATAMSTLFPGLVLELGRIWA